MENYENILYDKKGHGVLITLNRPGVVNALNRELCKELDEAFAQAKEDPEIRAIVITGAGGVFSAGEDLSDFGKDTAWPYGIPEGSSLAAEYNNLRDMDRGRALGSQMYRWEFPKPIIAAVSGWCLGAASWLALCCHLTIAADDAVFGQPQVRHGSATDFVWVLLAGFKNALRYSLTGDHIDSQEALRIGIVNQVVPKNKLLEESFRLVERIALIPPETVKISLHIATLGLEMMGLRKAWIMNSELAAMARLSKREEFCRHLEEAKKQGGLNAFLKERDDPFRPEPFGPKSK